MHSSRVQHDTVSCSALVGACAKGRQWQATLHIIEKMPHSCIARNAYSYCAAISGCASASQWEQAMELFERLGKDGIAYDRVAYNAVLDATQALPVGPLLFKRALYGNVYPGLLAHRPDMLDLHDLSPGAACLAVSWWLYDALPVTYASRDPPGRLEIITGRGKTRKVWRLRDVRSEVVQLFERV